MSLTIPTIWLPQPADALENEAIKFCDDANMPEYHVIRRIVATRRPLLRSAIEEIRLRKATDTYAEMFIRLTIEHMETLEELIEANHEIDRTKAINDRLETKISKRRFDEAELEQFVSTKLKDIHAFCIEKQRKIEIFHDTPHPTPPTLLTSLTPPVMYLPFEDTI